MDMLGSVELQALVDEAIAAVGPLYDPDYSPSLSAELSSEAIASVIDHTALKPDTTKTQIDQLCAEAREYRFASVCVNPTWVERCAEQLSGSPVQVCTVIGFPLGATLPPVKAFEAGQAIANGATELDMVINVGRLKAGDYAYVYADMAGVVEAARAGDAKVKVILETCLLTTEEKITGSVLAKAAGADFVKTSTGFSSGGATLADVALMRAAVGLELGVKAAGGIRTAQDVNNMVAAGATRIGASAGVAIMQSKSASSAASPGSSTGEPPTGESY
jgi:deoxyribose-phosphate aldolase